MSDAAIQYGLVLTNAITFIAIAWVLFLLVELYNQHVDKDDAGPSQVELLTEIRDSLAK